MIETFQAVLPHGITLSCRASGKVGAPVLLFLHGFPEAAFVWDATLEHFGDRYRCVAPNLRGFEPQLPASIAKCGTPCNVLDRAEFARVHPAENIPAG